MSNKKVLLLISAILAFTVIFNYLFKIDYKKLATDSGFDSSWDSGGSSDSSWSSSDSGSSGGGGSMSPEEAAVLMYMIGVSMAGYGLRRLFRKKEENDSMAIDSIFGIIFLVPLSIISAALVNDKITGIILPFAVSAVFFFLINIIRKKPLSKYVKIEYIVCTLAIIIFVVSSAIASKDPSQLLVLLFMLPFLVPFLFIMVLVRIITGQGFTDMLINSTKVETPKTKEEIKQLLEENNLEEEKVLKDAYEIYKRIQIAWMNDTLDDVNDCLSDEIKNMYSAQLLTLRRKNEQNVMSDFEYVSGDIKNVVNKKDNLEITLGLRVKCRDYLINKESGKVLRGNKNKINNYYYELAFLMNREAPKFCPNCGAALEKGGGVTCSSCKSKIVLNNGDMLMTKKRMISQS